MCDEDDHDHDDDEAQNQVTNYILLHIRYSIHLPVCLAGQSGMLPRITMRASH